MKLFVWDFHGVLEKDNDLAVLDVSNHILESHGYKERLTEEDNRNYYGFKWYEYFEHLLPNQSKKEHLSLQDECFTYCIDNQISAKYIKQTEHAANVIEAINEAGHDQILLSNTRPEDILWFIKLVKLENRFQESKIFGVNAHQKCTCKSDALRQYLSDKKFDSIVIIGDSASDMKLKDVNGGITYLFRHPHLQFNELVTADYTINDLRQILQEL